MSQALNNTPSRRGIIRSLATVAAAATAGAALAATAEAAVVPIPAASPAADQQSPIAALWADHRRLRRKYRALVRQYDEQQAKVGALMPNPHPSITRSPENNAICMTWLRRSQERDYAAYAVNAYIEPHVIEATIIEIEESRSAFLPIETVDIPAGASHLTKVKRKDGKVECFAVFDTVQPPTPEQAQRILPDLKGRLELSRAYEKKLESVERSLNLRGLDRGKAKVITAINRIERQILKLPARSADDTRIKLKLYARERNEFGGDVSDVAESLVRDLQQTLKAAAARAQS
jgi:hypothetical protein